MRMTPRKKYPQLSSETLAILHARLAYHHGNRSALARELGETRSGISQALDGKYPCDATKKLEPKIIERLVDQYLCPHLGVEIGPQACRAWRERPLMAATGSRSDVKHWQACQSCHHNPARSKGAA